MNLAGILAGEAVYSAMPRSTLSLADLILRQTGLQLVGSRRLSAPRVISKRFGPVRYEQGNYFLEVPPVSTLTPPTDENGYTGAHGSGGSP